MEEIIEHIFYEIKNSGYERKLIGGIVLTGGGAQMKHVAQLTEFVTGLDTRIGYPNEYLAKNVPPEMASPMFATSIGLVLVSSERYERERIRMKELEPEPVAEEEGKKKKVKEKKVKVPVERGKRFTEVFLEKIKNWFDEENE
jgi:cell division protein FtsA